MCGRFTIAEVKGLGPRFSIESPVVDIYPRYNIAPTQDVPIVISDSPNQLVMMRWGLIPFWAKDEKIGSRLINARAETVSTKPAFRSSLKTKRCLVPATGFYEWKKVAGNKEPFYVHLKDETFFAFAGLYDRWMSPEGKEVLSFTIITTDANSLMGEIHDRMPVILHREDEKHWLGKETPAAEELGLLFLPYPSEEMDVYRVSPAVNDPSKESEELIRPIRTEPIQTKLSVK
jgi:putative SOS response-associated peptidase YedK